MAKACYKISFVLIASIVFFVPQSWAKDPIYKGFFSNVAVGGYDTVTYFTKGMPLKGNKTFKTEYQGAEWFFSSADTLAAFVRDPKKYAPQYGGYCAWAVSQGYTAKGDPQQWTIHNDKLYLNYNADIQNKWETEKERFIVEADNNWPSVLTDP